jgi:hypothetical protein
MRLLGYIAVMVATLWVLGVMLDKPDPIRPEIGDPTSVPWTGRYANCEEATITAGPGPHREGTAGYDPFLDPDADGISCEE